MVGLVICSSFVRVCWVVGYVVVCCWIDRVRIAGFQLHFVGILGTMMIFPGFIGKVVRNENRFLSARHSLLPRGTVPATT
jgi:hypothetical protein